MRVSLYGSVGKRQLPSNDNRSLLARLPARFQIQGGRAFPHQNGTMGLYVEDLGSLTPELPAASPVMPFQSRVIDGVSVTNATGKFKFPSQLQCRFAGEMGGGTYRAPSSAALPHPLGGRKAESRSPQQLGDADAVKRLLGGEC